MLNGMYDHNVECRVRKINHHLDVITGGSNMVP